MALISCRSLSEKFRIMLWHRVAQKLWLRVVPQVCWSRAWQFVRSGEKQPHKMNSSITFLSRIKKSIWTLCRETVSLCCCLTRSEFGYGDLNSWWELFNNEWSISINWLNGWISLEVFRSQKGKRQAVCRLHIQYVCVCGSVKTEPSFHLPSHTHPPPTTSEQQMTFHQIFMKNNLRTA